MPFEFDLERLPINVRDIDDNKAVLSLLNVPQAVLYPLVQRRSLVSQTDDARRATVSSVRLGESFEAGDLERVGDDGAVDGHEDVAEEAASVEGLG
jgi:hypothetical protein